MKQRRYDVGGIPLIGPNGGMVTALKSKMVDESQIHRTIADAMDAIVRLETTIARCRDLISHDDDDQTAVIVMMDKKPMRVFGIAPTYDEALSGDGVLSKQPVFRDDRLVAVKVSSEVAQRLRANAELPAHDLVIVYDPSGDPMRIVFKE